MKRESFARVGLVLWMAGCALGATAARAENLEPQLVARATALREKALADTSAYGLVESLVNTVGPRPAGSEGDRQAVAWALAKLQELGFENVHAEPVTVPHWDRGLNRGTVLTPFSRGVVLTALGGSVATPPGGLDAEILRLTSLDAVKALPEGGARGKIVFIDEVMTATRDATGYVKAVAKRGAGASEAARKGAVALLIRSAGTSNHRVAHTGGIRYQPDVAKIPAAALANVDADFLAAQVARGGAVRFRLELETRSLPDEKSANVIGELKGRERPGEVVLLGAHLDSWDLGFGAQDDGSGCAVVMTATRLAAAGERPRRTLRVVLFANEEFGLSGATAYAEAHAAELAAHKMALEADLGTGKVWSMATGVDESQRGVAAEIAGLLKPLGIELGANTGRGGADLNPLRSARVPTLDLWQDATRYFEVHHTVDDTLAFVDREGLAQNVAAYAVAALAAAEWPGEWLPAPAETPAPGR